MKLTHLAIGAVMILSAFAGVTQAQSIEGTYQTQGKDTDGTAYGGKVTITQDAGVYKIGWELGSYGNYKGTGLLIGDVLAAAYGQGKPYGLAVYQVDGGKLTGKWVEGGKKVLGGETLEGAPGLAGTYKITSAQNADGSTYTGTVLITKKGDVYTVKWTLPDSTYTGVGLLQGSLFVVAWGEGKDFGAVAYKVGGGKLNGTWAGVGSSALGTEVLSK